MQVKLFKDPIANKTWFEIYQGTIFQISICYNRIFLKLGKKSYKLILTT